MFLEKPPVIVGLRAGASTRNGGKARQSRPRETAALCPPVPIKCPLEEVVDLSQHECTAAAAARTTTKAASINAVSPLGGTVSEAYTCEQIKGSASGSQAEVLVRAGESLNAVLTWCVVVCRGYDSCLQRRPEADAACGCVQT
jgi:hypothetical protein